MQCGFCEAEVDIVSEDGLSVTLQEDLTDTTVKYNKRTYEMPVGCPNCGHVVMTISAK